jgi:hypothetical protein
MLPGGGFRDYNDTLLCHAQKSPARLAGLLHGSVDYCL